MTRERSERGSRDSERGGRSSRDEGGDRTSRHNRDEEDRPSRGRDSGRSSRYEYQSRSVEDTKKRSNQGANDFDKILVDSIKVWKPNDGDNRIRIVLMRAQR